MPVPDGWNAKNTSQPCRKGRNRDRLSALEDAYGGCRVRIHFETRIVYQLLS